MADIERTLKWAKELEKEYDWDIANPSKDYRSINHADIAAAVYEARDIEARSTEKYGHAGGLVAVPAGTWTPSMSWTHSVWRLKNVVNDYKEKTPEGMNSEEWAAALAELVELCDKLNAIVDEVSK